MLKMPELRIRYNSEEFPVSARCSMCRAEMPRMKSQGASLDETIRWFSIQFDLHKKREHDKDH